MDVSLRDERPGDAQAIQDVTRVAFAPMSFSSGTEHLIVGWLRAAGALSLSLVAVLDERVVGHVAFSRVSLSSGAADWFALGPVSVAPGLQRGGIGSRLIQAGITRLQGLGAAACVLSGNPAYYNRFGFFHDDRVQLEDTPPEAALVLRFTDVESAGFVRFHETFSRPLPGTG